jgi:hypothetical protein
MASTRLSDAQRQELVARYQQGETAQALAEAFGCSAATVTRVVKAAIGPERYEQIKLERGKGLAGHKAAAASPTDNAVTSDAVTSDAATSEDAIAIPSGPLLEQVGADPLEPFGSGFAAAAHGDPGEQADAPDSDDDSQVLPIDDADDFAGDADESDADDDSDDDDDDAADDDELDLFTPVPVGETLFDRPAATCQPFEAAPLPDSLYMLVDKTVELQDRPLSDFPELGLLPEEESRRRALVVFSNPRQAKRHCGRTQRVIKVPDSQVIRRTAPYLLRKGITRVVLEGALYSLPGS